MRIRFLQTTQSDNPAYPFQAGQEIIVSPPSPYLLSLCDGVHAEIVTMDETERALAPDVLYPEPKVPKGRKRVRH